MLKIQVPELGERVDEAEVVKVLVAQGDSVDVDQAVLELETDKATFEMPCTESGTVAEIRVQEGDTVRVGQTVMTLDADGGDTNETKGTRKDKKEKKEKDKEQARDRTKETPQKAEEAEETEEADIEEAEEAEGKDAEDKDKEAEEHRDEKAEKEEDDEEGEGETQRPTDAPRDKPKDNKEKQAEQRAPRSGQADWVAGPATRRLARELGVNLSELGPASSGRITRDDVKSWVRDRRGDETETALPDFTRWSDIERHQLSRLERTAAMHLDQAWRSIPHVTQHDEAEISALETARQRYEENRRQADPKLTWTVLAVKAVVAVLREKPRFNSSFDPSGPELIVKKYRHIGIAVDTKRGLVVPVIRDADRKTTREIAIEVAQLATRAREQKLTLEEMQGGTFTISNLGGLGGTSFTPIVNHPEVAILGMARARKQPPTEPGAPARLVLPLSLSYDHRVIDGASAVRFLRRIVELLEDPLQLLMES